MRIQDIEKKIVDLTIREKDLEEQRSGARTVYLKRAEGHPAVHRAHWEVLVKGLGIDARGVSRYSQEGLTGGAGGEEYLTDVLVTVFAAAPAGRQLMENCPEISMRLKITGGFDDPATRETERRLTAEIMEIRREVEDLKSQKRQMKQDEKR
ncbi:MAG: hypothetical protein JXA20_19180 [Spirochaetes bacterium]|nr:hypothetical protein [Spirochaetota bacterium]